MKEMTKIPLLEYDGDSLEVIAPNHDSEGLKLPEKCLFAFLGDVVHTYAEEHHAKVVDEFETVSHRVKIYVLQEGQEEICLVQPIIGAPAATSLLDTLISCGCKQIMAVGSCGVLADMQENAFLVPTKALRDEGTSYHYLPASRYISLDPEPVKVMEACFAMHKLPFQTCTTWTTDGFFRETKEKVKARLEEGCFVVEMECAALAACSRKRGATFGQFLFTADSLANVQEYDARDFGRGAHEKALWLGLEVLKMMGGKEASVEQNMSGMELIRVQDSDYEKTYELYMSFDQNENGYINSVYGFDYEQFLDWIEMKAKWSEGKALPEGFVPDTTYVLCHKGVYVGVFNLRHELNDFLREGPGHIGYCISKKYRGQSYATIGLGMALEKAKERGITEAYLSVNKTNPASLQVMLKNGAYIHHEDEEEYYTRIPLV